MQNYLDYAVLDKIAVKVLWVANWSDSVEKSIKKLKKHEQPTAIHVQNLEYTVRLSKTFAKDFVQVDDNLWTIDHNFHLRLLFTNDTSEIVKLRDPKHRSTEESQQKNIITCVPPPFFGDNRIISLDMIMCRFILRDDRNVLLHQKVPLYYQLPGLTPKVKLLNKIMLDLLALGTDTNLQILKIVKLRCINGKDNAKINTIKNLLPRVDLTWRDFVVCIEANLLVDNTKCLNLSTRGRILLYASSSMDKSD
jgi:hypothetical protein